MEADYAQKRDTSSIHQCEGKLQHVLGRGSKSQPFCVSVGVGGRLLASRPQNRMEGQLPII